MDRGPRTGVAGAVSVVDLDFRSGGGGGYWGLGCCAFDLGSGIGGGGGTEFCLVLCRIQLSGGPRRRLSILECHRCHR